MGKGIMCLGRDQRLDARVSIVCTIGTKIWWRHILQSATFVLVVAGCRLNPSRYV
jgi:hypothetical protein